MSFTYFAYGSNLLSKRIHINNPSAIRIGIGKLENYRLDFLTYSHRWKGAAATIVPTPDSVVWGSIWEIDKNHLETLDKQEGVHNNVYFPLNINVKMDNGTNKLCRVYQQTRSPKYVPDIALLPEERKPSQVYLYTILEGAQESELPAEYQELLKKIPHNGYNGNVDMQNDIIRKD